MAFFKQISFVLLSFGAVGLMVACEPLAPEANQQQIIVITNTPTPENTPIPTALLSTPLPSRIPPTPTATVFVPPTAPVATCTESEGRLLDMAFPSQITEALIEYQIYLPPCFYITGRRYPYVILLHGSGYDNTQWSEEIGIHGLLDQNLSGSEPSFAPMVLIMPNGGDAEENNLFEAGLSFEDILLNELIPDVEQNFCVWNAPEGRAIGGISRGGFWAFSIALRHPTAFVSVGGHSPAFVEDNAPPSHNPLNLAQNVPFNSPLRIYLDIARNDGGEAAVTIFSNTLRNNGVSHLYNISATGGHDNDYWASQALDYLDFYSTPWPKTVGELPSCF